MDRYIGLAVSALLLLTSGTAGAQGKQRACALLTVEEVAGVVGATPERPGEHDEVIEKGPWTGETHRRCNWPLGQSGRNGNVLLMVTAMRTDEQRKASAEILEKPSVQFKAEGWTVTKKRVGSATCIVTMPPPSEKAVKAGVTCVTEARGNALSIAAILTAATVTPEQLMALLDKAVGRLS